MLEVVVVIEHVGVDHCELVTAEVEVPKVGHTPEGICPDKVDLAINQCQLLQVPQAGIGEGVSLQIEKRIPIQ